MMEHEAKKMVLSAFDEYRGANLTQYYAVVNRLRGGEARIDTYACRLDNRTRKPLCKCVQRCYSNRLTIDVRDIVRGYMGGFQVDFSDLTRNCRHYHERMYTDVANARFPVGSWDTMEYVGPKTGFLVCAQMLNDFKGTKFEHSGIERWHNHPMRFFECYGISRSVEFLVKAGLGRFVTPAFVRRLKDDRRTFDFFRRHVKEIQGSWGIGIREVTVAVANRCSLAEAVKRVEASEAFKASRYNRNENIPVVIDRWELMRYCERNGVEPREYRRYAGYIANAGGDLCAYGVTYPRDFRKALEDAERESHRIDEIERRRQRRIERERERVGRMGAKERAAFERREKGRIAEALAAMAKRLAVINGISGYGYVVVVPKSAKMLVAEGHAMKNCIGGMGYDRKIADGESLIFFLRGLDGRKNVDVEVRVTGKGRSASLDVVQCYCPCNQKAPDEANAFAREIADRARDILFRKAA